MTLPAFIQRVQTLMRRTFLLMTARTRCRFGLKRLFVRLFAWLTRFPNMGPLSQISHRCAMTKNSPFPYAYWLRPIGACIKSQTQEYSIRSTDLSRPDVLQWPLFFKGLESFREINFESGGTCRPASHRFL